MPIISYLQSLGVTHGMLLQDQVEVYDVSSDFGDSPDPTRLRTDQNGTQWDMTGNPVCEGVSASLLAYGDNTDFTTKTYAGEIDARLDINASNNGNLADANDSSVYNWSTGSRLMACWFKQKVSLSGVPTAILGHGGGTNNQLLSVGLGGKIVFQSADAGQPYLAHSSIDDFQVDRSYFVCGLWEHHTQHSGSGNRITLYVNGVSQGSFELTGTDAMASATGQPFIGNAQSNYQSYGAGTIGYLRREKEVNLALFFNNQFFSENTSTENDLREIFERTVIPEVTIEADTIENQQTALDALIGSDYSNTNCAIRIIQATDATDYRLFFDNQVFPDNTNINDISIQFVGNGVLTAENTNGSNITIISTPIEVERTSGILNGGGSVLLIQDTVRLNSVQDLINITANKVVFENAGDYNLTNCNITEYENVSGGVVNIVSNTGVSVITETSGTFNIQDSVLIFQDVDSWSLFLTDTDRDTNSNVEASGTGFDNYNFSYSGNTTYYLRLVTGSTTIFQDKNITSSGETLVSLSTVPLILSLQSQMTVEHEELRQYGIKSSDNAEQVNNKI